MYQHGAGTHHRAASPHAQPPLVAEAWSRQVEASVWLPWAPADWAPVLLCCCSGQGPGKQGPHLLFHQGGGCETGVHPAQGHTAQGPCQASVSTGCIQAPSHLGSLCTCCVGISCANSMTPAGQAWAEPQVAPPGGAPGVPEGSPTHFPKQRRRATCPGSHSTLPDRKARGLPASVLSPHPEGRQNSKIANITPPPELN